MKGLRRLGIGAAALVILLDQISKPLMRDWLAGGDIYVTPFFNLVSAWNQGVGFSLMTMRGTSGPYVLSGGELPAMVLVDAIARRLPGALADGSGEHESFSEALDGGLEYPHYTRPAEFRGWKVPDVLLSGHHGQIDDWRRKQSRARSRETTVPTMTLNG